MEYLPGQFVKQFRNPLVFIALETTGSNVDVDQILEIAVFTKPMNLLGGLEGPNIVIHHTGESLDKTGKQYWERYRANGLLDEVEQSEVTLHDAEIEITTFVKAFITDDYRPNLAGKLVYKDYAFLKKYMPNLAKIFSHVMVDVCSIRALCERWYPEGVEPYRWEKKYRARLEFEESISELVYYREKIMQRGEW